MASEHGGPAGRGHRRRRPRNSSTSFFRAACCSVMPARDARCARLRGRAGMSPPDQLSSQPVQVVRARMNSPPPGQSEHMQHTRVRKSRTRRCAQPSRSRSPPPDCMPGAKPGACTSSQQPAPPWAQPAVVHAGAARRGRAWPCEAGARRLPLARARASAMTPGAEERALARALSRCLLAVAGCRSLVQVRGKEGRWVGR